MARLSDEDFEKIKHLEDRFQQAKCDYIRRVVTDDFQTVENIYERLTRNTNYRNGSCATCVLKVFKYVAEAYDEYVLEKASEKARRDAEKNVVEPKPVSEKKTQQKAKEVAKRANKKAK